MYIVLIRMLIYTGSAAPSLMPLI